MHNIVTESRSQSNSTEEQNHKPKFWGYTIQFFIIAVLPLTLLLLIVAFGSQSLHRDAMREMVGDRDLETVRTASGSIDRELSHLSSTLSVLARDLNGKQNFDQLIHSPDEINVFYDGGIALFTLDGKVLHASSESLDWNTIFQRCSQSGHITRSSSSKPILSNTLTDGLGSEFLLMSVLTEDERVLIAAFTPARLVENANPALAESNQTSLYILAPQTGLSGPQVLFRSGPAALPKNLTDQDWANLVLAGVSGIQYIHDGDGERLIAYAPIPSAGWGLVIEEDWEDIAGPYLTTTQTASLVLVPAFLLAIFAIWHGFRNIVNPLSKLEQKAASLAGGDFDAIQQPVGGIREIQNLQIQLSQMAIKLRAAQVSLRSYIGSITAGVESERRNLARELHDDTIQSLIALNQRVQIILMRSQEPQKQNLIEVRDLVQRSIDNLRRLIRGLRPIYLEDLGLSTSLEMLANETAQNNNLSVGFKTTGSEIRLDPRIEMSLYRMVQESLNNAAKHARPASVSVRLEYSAAQIKIEIKDDGRGFTPPSDPNGFPRQGHFGLLGLRERADLIGAELKLSSAPGKGTRVLISLPIKPA